MSREIGEECGVAAVSLRERRAPQRLYKLLLDMQNRGQLSAGITTFSEKRLQILDTYKDLGTVNEVDAELLCLICPTCFGQFDHGQARVAKAFDEDFKTPAVYYAQLLAFAQGVPYDKLGFERQRFKPEALKRFEGEAAAAGES